MLEISGRRVPFNPADKCVLATAGEFSDKLVEIADGELVAECEERQNSTQRLKTKSAKLAKTEAKSSDQAGSEQPSRLSMVSLDVAQRSSEDQPAPQRNDVEAFQYALLELTTLDRYEHYPAADDRYARCEE
jgi:hypothetical protein